MQKKNIVQKSINKKNKTNRDWVSNHINDHYVHQAAKDGYRSRAAYKLLEIEEEYNIFKSVLRVVDLGCAPGSWSQVATKKVGATGVVIGVDLLPIDPIANLHFIQGDFTQEGVLNQLVDTLDGRLVDLVISDIAPNLSGIKGVDQARIAGLTELVLDFAKNHLISGGHCVIKVFQGGQFDDLVKLAREIFKQVLIKKPTASRDKSSEIYLLCRNKLVTTEHSKV
jgi:23S rRNA (uridine2552-2'-O)-methyltransferase